MAFEPIMLNAAGDILLPGPFASSDVTPLFHQPGFRRAKIGEHGICCDDVLLLELANCNAVICSEMALRVEVPKSVDTYAKLRQWCASQIESERQRQCDLDALVVQNTRF